MAPGARALGAAFQKVNFLRDIAEDLALGRYYFPELQTAKLDEEHKQRIITDIRHDFETAEEYIEALPRQARAAVTASYRYYLALFDTLQATPTADILARRVRISTGRKWWILLRVAVSDYFSR